MLPRETDGRSSEDAGFFILKLISDISLDRMLWQDVVIVVITYNKISKEVYKI